MATVEQVESMMAKAAEGTAAAQSAFTERLEMQHAAQMQKMMDFMEKLSMGGNGTEKTRDKEQKDVTTLKSFGDFLKTLGNQASLRAGTLRCTSSSPRMRSM